MTKTILHKALKVGRATALALGVGVMLAVVLGLASVALGADGDFFKVGRQNVASSVSVLEKRGGGAALKLLVDSGPPLAVNSGARVTNLNADRVDGRDATMWAKVAANGTATASYGLSASSKTPMDGSYKVQFIQDIRQCATTATLPADGQGGDIYASVGPLPEPNAVLVETFNSQGLRADRPFSLAVFC